MVAQHDTPNPKDHGLDLSPLVRDRANPVQAIDEDGDGIPDVFAYDPDNDGVAEIVHRVADRRTLAYVSAEPPFTVPPTTTAYTGSPSEVSLRVTFRVRRIDAQTFELNGVPSVACVESHGLLSIGKLWDADREHRDEVRAARAFLELNDPGTSLVESVVRATESGLFAAEGKR